MQRVKKTCNSLDALYERFAGGDHSIFSPSASARWLPCPGSLIPNLLAPDDTGIFAAEGTVAHELAEEWLITATKPSYRIGQVIWVDNKTDWFEIRIDRAMMTYVEEYVDWCMMTPGRKFIESRVDFSMLTPVPNQKGTLDFSSVYKRTLYIKDLKYGKGVQVEVVKNSQLLIYAYAKYMEIKDFYDIDKIVIGIGQPRLGGMSEWELSVEELLGFGEMVKPKAKAAWDFNAPRVAGQKQCTFCRVRSTCPALAAMAQDVTNLWFPEDDEFRLTPRKAESLKRDIDEGTYHIDMPPPMSLDNGQLAKVLNYRKPIENWFKSLYTELQRRAMKGESIPGYKLVEGKNFRDFRDVYEVEKALIKVGLDEDELWKTEFLSPAQAEDALMQKGFKRKELPDILDKHVVLAKGASSLVPESDKRPALASDYKSAMNDEEDDGYGL